MIALRHLRAGGSDCVGRSIARWSSFMHVSVYLEAESPCQFPVLQTTHFGALVRLLFHELLGLQLRRLLRWSSIGAREGFYLLCSLLLEPWIKKTTNYMGGGVHDALRVLVIKWVQIKTCHVFGRGDR